MLETVLTFLNQWASSGRCRRFWGVVTEIFWVDKIRVYETKLDSAEMARDNDRFIQWKIASEEDIDAMSQLGVYDVEEKFMKSFVRSRHEYLLLGMKDDVIHTYAVCSVQKKRMNGIFFKLADDETFISICYTIPASRGQGWGPRCIQEIFWRCHQTNAKHVFIDISTSNNASIRSATKAGFLQTDSWYYRVRIWKRDHLFPFGKYRERFYAE